LVERGAARVYATARNPGGVADLVERHKGKVVPLKLDITQPADIAAAAAACRDVLLLVNNAGINRQAGFIAASDLAAARAEMETNYFGPLAMCRAFGPILAANGGARCQHVVHLARVALPMYGSLSASKAAALSLTQGVRGELAKQGTLVIAVMPGAVDTEMERNFPPPKLPPADAARAALDAVEQGLEESFRCHGDRNEPGSSPPIRRRWKRIWPNICRPDDGAARAHPVELQRHASLRPPDRRPQRSFPTMNEQASRHITSPQRVPRKNLNSLFAIDALCLR
jgi:NAD(P)-dependent dehydrogenase (short-subunit alcohol dehydrogenase family)